MRYHEILNESADGDAYFDMDGPDVADTRGRGSRTILVHMRPEDFLRMAKYGRDDAKATKVAGLLDRAVKFSQLPWLSFRHDNTGNAYVIGHEGRHRARALQARYVKNMPVILNSISDGDRGPAIRWNEPRNTVAVMPTVLHGEDGTWTIPMPKTNP